MRVARLVVTLGLQSMFILKYCLHWCGSPLQAEYARVPLADINALKVPEGISDAKVGTCTAAR